MVRGWGYRAIVTFRNATGPVYSTILYEGFNPNEAKGACARVCANPMVVELLQIRDREGPLQTLYNREWSIY